MADIDEEFLFVSSILGAAISVIVLLAGADLNLLSVTEGSANPVGPAMTAVVFVVSLVLGSYGSYKILDYFAGNH